MPQFRNAMNEGTIYDCISTYEAYKLHKDKDKTIEHVSELKCKNKYPFYMLRQDIENRQKKNKISKQFFYLLYITIMKKIITVVATLIALSGAYFTFNKATVNTDGFK